MKKNACFVALALLAASAAGPADAQSPVASYPSRPVKLVIPFPPGGSLDIVVRAIAQKLTEAWGQQVIIDTRGGGASSTAPVAYANVFTVTVPYSGAPITGSRPKQW